MPMRAMGLAAAALMAISPFASAALIDFQGEAIGNYAGGTTTLLVDGVSVNFSAPGLNIRDISGSFPAGSDRVMSSAGDSGPIVMEFLNAFTADGLSFRNWIAGVHTGEVDTIRAEAFDSGGGSLGVVISSAEFINLAFLGIAKVSFDDVNTGFVLDEIRFNARVVPEPGMLALIGLGFAGLGFARRRRSS